MLPPLSLIQTRLGFNPKTHFIFSQFAQVKVHVRKLLPSGLADEHSKVRNTVAYAVAAIAHWDWPENWPDLFDQLMLALNSSNPNIVHGTMRVLTGESRNHCTTGNIHHLEEIFPFLLHPLPFHPSLQSFVVTYLTRRCLRLPP